MLATLSSLFLSIPSPSRNVIEIGPLTLRMYGLCIAVGALVAVSFASRRWVARGGSPDDVGSIAIWAIPAGVIGARIYHVATDWKTYQGDWGAALNITKGGLGIPGGIALGAIVGVLVVKRKGLPVKDLLDVAAPALPIAQAIGRLGNWFNQELFGRPTTLAWGLEIDPQNRPSGYEAYETFHPTFLYEALWNLSLAALLVWIDAKGKLRRGELFVLYVFGYSLGRLWVEEMRIDHASLIWGVRVNIWMSVIAGLVAAGILVWNRRGSASAPGVGADADAGAWADVDAGAEVADSSEESKPQVSVGGASEGANEGASEGAIEGDDQSTEAELPQE